jgi:tetratricopeptide (TPR) repeat protein
MNLLAALKLSGGLDQLPSDIELGDVQSRQNAELWYLLGRAYLREGAHEESYRTLQQAVYLEGPNATAWITIGVLHYDMRQYEDSQDALERAIRLNPYFPEPWYNLFVLVSLVSSRRKMTLVADAETSTCKTTSSRMLATLSQNSPSWSWSRRMT